MCVWSIEADILDFNNSDIVELVYRNNDVERFISAKNSMGIAACKGMGKTFLLKAKRMEMMNADKSILILPQDQIVDVSGTIALKAMHINFLSSYSNWVSLWISCIAIYILSLENFRNILEDVYITELPESAIKLLNKKNTGIFNVLHRVLAYESKEKLNEIVQASSLLFDYLQLVHQQVAIFVDKLEEPFNRGYFAVAGSTISAEGGYNASIWSYAQLAFAEAVYTLYSGRHHIKIFYSIRREALYKGEQISTEFIKLDSRIVRLAYTPNELYEMFCLYISKEKAEDLSCPELANSNPIKALVGLDEITHRSGNKEKIWDYVYRHTFQRPRDIMEMCESIHRNIVKLKKPEENIDDQKIKLLRHWINEVSTMECMSYLSFLEPFMSREDNILFKEKILEFARRLPMNIYTEDSMEFFCQSENACKECKCIECKETHYFSTLYNIGLLGYMHKSINNSKYEMKIKHIGDSRFDSTHRSLPAGTLFYLHPGFGNIVQKEREVSMRVYIPCKYVVNSLGVEISTIQIRDMIDTIKSTMGNLNDKCVFITSTGRDLNNERGKIKKILERKGYKVLMYEEPDFPQMENTIENAYPGATHDHCIDVMMSCKHVIYIFSGRYGGKYFGKRYSLYHQQEEVIEEIPSISFMEYLVAKKTGKNVKVYVDEKVEISRGEFIANNQPPHFQSKIVENVKVYKQLGYFNKLGNGTWYETYNGLSDLEKFIERQFPNLNESMEDKA